MRGDVTVLHHHLSLVGCIYRMLPANPALVVLCVGKTLVDSVHHIMSLSGGRTSTAGLCLFLFFTWLSPWTSSQVARKLVALMLMWWVGYDSYKNMYENRNVHLYFTDFITYHMAVIFTPFFCTYINENQVHPLSLQYPMPWSVGCTTRNGGDPLLCDQAAQDTCPIRTSAPQMPTTSTGAGCC